MIMSPKKSSAAFASKNLKKLAPAFVVTVALLVPQGCGGNVDDGSGPGASGTGGSGGTGGSTAKGGTGGSSGASGTAGKGGGGGTENTIDCRCASGARRGIAAARARVASSDR